MRKPAVIAIIVMVAVNVVLIWSDIGVFVAGRLPAMYLVKAYLVPASIALVLLALSIYAIKRRRFGWALLGVVYGLMAHVYIIPVYIIRWFDIGLPN